ncbi:hypothetical protein HDF16_005440 [Granulicella aggregans]|uniref:Uncharacterized protein n=1 Tax=Granulicella aggregans TaxID=474949 RepID=A0A7W7ZJH9_9BACT|nr:hypothetical protein [Granulicella aggregans]MBB5060704.1 hypothetical protein [Granulicella aggregans]
MLALEQRTQPLVQTGDGDLDHAILNLLNKVEVSKRREVSNDGALTHMEEDLVVFNRLIESQCLNGRLLPL